MYWRPLKRTAQRTGGLNVPGMVGKLEVEITQIVGY